METVMIDREVYFSISDFKSYDSLGEFLARFLNWSDENEQWFNDNYNLAINYYLDRVKLAPFPALHSFKVIMNHIMSGKIVATYDQKNHKIINKYKYNACGSFGMYVNGFWGVITPDEFFKLNNEVFVIVKKEEEK